MEALKNVNCTILSTLQQIEKRFPGLSKYIGEMPVRISEKTSPEAGLKNLEDYYDSLATLLKNYAKTHTAASYPVTAFSSGNLSDNWYPHKEPVPRL